MEQSCTPADDARGSVERDCGTRKLQRFPTTGMLSKNMNIPLTELEDRVTEEMVRPVLAYVVASLERSDNGELLQQAGSGPNIEGNYVTLCTCKHQMRCSRAARNEDGVWVAGFSGVGGWEERGNWLWYLMKARIFGSQFEIHGFLPKRTIHKKAAHRNFLGDVFTPKRPSLKGDARFDPDNYKKPDTHSHAQDGKWRKDIRYERWNRRPALLVGDPSLSFIWPVPRLRLKNSDTDYLPRDFKTFDTLTNLLERLEERET